MGQLEERYKQDILDRVEFILEQGLDLNIIYLRVSTKDKGQQERDQLKDILKTFNLVEEQCIIIEAKESAYKLKAQKTRKLNIVVDICKKYEDYEKTLFIWDLDRLYRNQDKQVDFIRTLYIKYNTMIYSHRQEWLNKLRENGGMGKAMYNFMIEMLGYLAEDGSKKKGERLLKSYHQKNNRTYTNKNRLVGRKLKDLNGNKLNLKHEQLDKLEKFIITKFKNGWTYDRLIKYIATKNIKVSAGYLNNIKKKYS